MMWVGNGMGYGWHIAGWVMMVAFWGGLIALGFFAVRSFSRASTGPTVGQFNQTPLEILQARYARGEISKAAYEEMKSDLAS